MGHQRSGHSTCASDWRLPILGHVLMWVWQILQGMGIYQQAIDFSSVRRQRRGMLARRRRRMQLWYGSTAAVGCTHTSATSCRHLTIHTRQRASITLGAISFCTTTFDASQVRITEATAPPRRRPRAPPLPQPPPPWPALPPRGGLLQLLPHASLEPSLRPLSLQF